MKYYLQTIIGIYLDQVTQRYGLALNNSENFIIDLILYVTEYFSLISRENSC